MKTLPPWAASIGFPIRNRNFRRFSVNFRLSRCVPASLLCPEKENKRDAKTREEKTRCHR